jgi:tetratricopeptide (TPR) repeat protein
MPPSGLSQNAQTIVKEIESLQEALKTEPKNSTALLRLANLYYDTRAFASAIMMYDRYLEINPANPDARVDLGTAYFEMALRDSMNREQYLTAAKEQMVRALSVNPRHQLAHYNLGMVSLRGGNLEEANDWFRKCAAIDSNTETGRRALQLVKQHSFTNPS